MMSILYNLLLLFLSPVLAVYYVWRVLGTKKSRRSWRQQMGLLPDSIGRQSSHPRIWIQAVSVGETVAASPIIRELRRIIPEAELIVSTTTTTGQKMARKALPEADHIIYFPIDLIPFVRRSFSAVNPDIFVCVESEIWPNFLAHARSRGIPAIVVNGIVSENTLRWGKRLRFIYKWALSNVEQFLMQTDEDARRIIELGAPEDRVMVVGNCKFDQKMEPLTPEQIRKIRLKYGLTNGQRVIVAGSTNPGEDEPVLDAFKITRQVHPDLKLIIAPRQIERTDEIAQMAEARGFSCGRRSLSKKLTGKEDVIILDTFGELAAVYGIGEAAFVGGSLIPKGGHNILQPIAQGKPVFFGPFTFKARDLVAQAKSAGVGFEIRNANELGRQITDFLSNADALNDIRAKALEMIGVNKGASKRCAEAILAAMGNEQ